MDEIFDAVIVGGGPAGASCAAACARAGMRVLVLERAVFPRDKVCGDCLNPACYPVLERLGALDGVRALPHAVLRTVEFISAGGRRVELPLPGGEHAEIAVRRSLLDALLLDHAAGCGAEVRMGVAVSQIARIEEGFRLTLADGRTARGRLLVAADGRNSLVARSAGLLQERRTPAGTDRVGLQAHIPCPPEFAGRVQLRWFASGYGGLAPAGGGVLNISLAGPAAAIPGLKRWAEGEFGVSADERWGTIAPIDRAAARDVASADGVFLAGDAARVVEPFTGEGIYYALRSGEVAAEAVRRVILDGCQKAEAALFYRQAHRGLYRGRLWINRLARLAILRPGLASAMIEMARWQPGLLRLLTAKVVPAPA
jgi:geranylgeranyl reductase family protein